MIKTKSKPHLKAALKNCKKRKNTKLLDQKKEEPFDKFEHVIYPLSTFMIGVFLGSSIAYAFLS